MRKDPHFADFKPIDQVVLAAALWIILAAACVMAVAMPFLIAALVFKEFGAIVGIPAAIAAACLAWSLVRVRKAG